MKEQWSQDIRQKLSDYESPVIPEGLWDDIEKEMSPRPAIVPFFSHWRKICAAILLLIALSATTYFLSKESEQQTLALQQQKETKVASPETKNHTTEKQTNSVDQQVASAEKEDISTSIKQQISTDKNRHISTDKHVTPYYNSTVTEPNIIAMTEHQPSENQEDASISIDNNSEVQLASATSTTEETTTMQEEDKKSASKRPDFIPQYHADDDFHILHKQHNQGLILALNTSKADGFAMNLGGASDDLYSYDDPIPGISGEEGTFDASKIVDNAEHHRPVSLGLQVGIPLSERWTMHTGLTYTYLHSEFENGTKDKYDHTHQRLYYLGVPVKMDYRIYHSNVVDLYLGGGFRMDFGLSGNKQVQTIEKDRPSTATNHSLSDIPTNTFLTVSPGMQVNITKGLSIYMEPSLLWLMSDNNKYKNYYSHYKQVFDFNLGVRWNLSK